MKVDAELTSTRFGNWVMKIFFFFFCGAWCGQLDIEKQHLDFFGDSANRIMHKQPTHSIGNHMRLPSIEKKHTHLFISRDSTCAHGEAMPLDRNSPPKRYPACMNGFWTCIIDPLLLSIKYIYRNPFMCGVCFSINYRKITLCIKVW